MRFREFGAISRTCLNPPCSKPWAIAQGFCWKMANLWFLRNHPKSIQKVPQGVKNLFATVLEAFQGVWSDFQNLPKSAMFKTMGYSPGFLLKTANLWPLRNHPKSIQKVPQGVRNLFASVLEAFQGVWSDFQYLRKSTMFKTMGYSPGFLLKIGEFVTLAKSPQIDTESPARSSKSICKRFGGVSGSLERFPVLAKIHHVQNHGL